MAAEEQTAQVSTTDNGPEQITRPAQFPTATRIENGVAYDASGKALGSVDEKALSVGDTPSSFRTRVQPDPFAALGATSAPAPQTQQQQDPFAALGATTAPAPDGQPIAVEQEKPGAIHKLWDFVNKGLVSKDTVLDTLQRASLTGKYQDVTTRGIHPTTHIPGFGDIDLNTLQQGVEDSVSGVVSSFTSPLSIALFGGGTLLQSGKAVQAARAAKAAETASTAADAAETVHAARLGEIATATKQVDEAQQAVSAAREAEAAGTGSRQAVIAAENNASAATANLTKAQKAVSEAKQAMDLHKVTAAQAARDAEAAATASKAAGVAGKLPELPKPLSTGIGVLSKTAGTGFTLMGAQQALEPRQPGESDADYAERVLGGAGWGLLGAEALKGTPVDIVLGEVPSKVIALPKDAAEAVKNWKEARDAKKEFIKRDADAIQAKKDFQKSIPSGTGAAKYDDEDYAVGRGYLERHIADPNLEPITNASDVADAFEYERQRVENKARAAIAIYGKEPVPINVRQYVREQLASQEAVKAGTIDAAMKTLEPYNLTDITLEEGDKTRQKLNSETRGVLKKNFWDVKTALETDPEFAAKYYANEALREGTWNLLEDKGVTGVREARRDEKSLVNLRNAAGRQINKGEAQRRGSSEVGPGRQMLAKGAKMAATGIGAGIGAAIPLPGTTEAGAIAGAKVGEIIAGKIAPPDLTVDQLISRSLSKKGGGVEPTEIDISKAQPSKPPVEVIPPKPREHTPLHSDMATHYGETIGDTPYDDLEKRFLSDIAIKKENKVPLDTSEKSLLKQINQAKVADILAQKKAIEDAQKKEAEATAAAEKEIKTGKPAAAPGEPEKEPEPPKGGKPAAKTTVPEELTEAQIKKGEKKEAVEEAKAVGSHVAEATQPTQEITQLPAGYTSQDAHQHEWAHVAQAVLDELPVEEIRSDKHPKSSPGMGATTVLDASQFMDENGKFALIKATPKVAALLRHKMSGMATNEILGGIPRSYGEKTGGVGDITQARQIYRLAYPDASDADIQQAVDNAYNETKKLLTRPEILDRIKANATVREENLPDTLHASRGRIERFATDLKEAVRRADEEAGNVPRVGRDVRRGAQEGQPGGIGEGARALGGRGLGAQARAAEREVRIPPERTTGDAARDESIRRGGAVPAGIQKGDPSIGLRELTLFHDPKTGSTLALPSDAISADLVAKHLAKSREAFGVSPITTEPKQEHPLVTALKEKFGSTSDPESLVRPGAQFLHSDGTVTSLGATEHPLAIAMAQGKGPLGGADIDRPEFINDTGTIRSRFRPQARRGPELVFSIPVKGITPEQVSMMKQGVGKMGRNGNLLIEVAHPQQEISESAYSWATPKEFARPSDVDSMLREIGAHPEGKGKFGKTSNGWLLNDGSFNELKPKEEHWEAAHRLGISESDAEGDEAVQSALNAGHIRIIGGEGNPEFEAATDDKESLELIKKAIQQNPQIYKTAIEFRQPYSYTGDSTPEKALQFLNKKLQEAEVLPEQAGRSLMTETAISKAPLKENELRNVADEFNKAHGRPSIDTTHVPEDTRSSAVADAYRAAVHAPNDPAVKASYDALKRDVKDQYHLAQRMGIKMDVKDENPYGLSTEKPAHEELHDDVRNNKHLSVWSGGAPPADHPLSEVDPETGHTYNELFRMVHDIFGHAAERTDFSPSGEETAWNLHRQMFSPEARPALATETKGQAAYTYKYGDFPPQKAAILPEEFHAPEPKNWASTIVSSMKEQPAGAINPRTGQEENTGTHGVEVYPEARTVLDRPATADDIRAFYNQHKDLFDKHPELRLGWYQSPEGKTELNIGASGTEKGAKTLGRKLDQRSVWDINNKKEISTGGKGEKTAFPEYPLEQRLAELKGDKLPAGVKDFQGTPALEAEVDTSLPRFAFGGEPEARFISGKRFLNSGVSTEALRSNLQEFKLSPEQMDYAVNRISSGQDVILHTPDARPEVMEHEIGHRERGPKESEAQKYVEEKLGRVPKPLPSRVIEEPEGFAFGKNIEGTPDQQKGLISTRVPSGPKATENPLEQDLKIGREAVEQNPKMAEKMADLVREYPGMRIPENIKDPNKVLDRFVDHVKENLKTLYNQVPAERRETNAKWYDSANNMASRLSEKFGKSTKQMAGIIAAMSPQKDWNQNVSLAERVNDIYHTKQDQMTTPEMMSKGAEIGSRPTGKVFAELTPKLEGKRLSELTDPVEKAAWIRLYDEAHNPREFQDIDPATGQGRGIVKTDTGKPQRVSWGGLSEIGKALSILKDGSRENISNNLGDAHKVRNFYNNILDPNNPAGHITVDTHAVAAALMRPLSGKSSEVLHNFGVGKGPSSSINGVNGTYALYADAYRAAAKDLGIQPRQLQSVVWEEIRNMFPRMMRRPEYGHKAAIDDIWNQYGDRKITLDKTHELVRDYAQKAAQQMEESRKSRTISAQELLEALGQGGLFALRGKE